MPRRKSDRSGLGCRGQALWDAYAEHDLKGGSQALLLEACRIADRLDKLHALLVGDADVWCHIEKRYDTDDPHIVVDNALAEARRQADTLRQLVGSLTSSEGGGGSSGDAFDAWVAGLSSAVGES